MNAKEIIECIKKLDAAGVAAYGHDPCAPEASVSGSTSEDWPYYVHIYINNPLEKYDAIAQISTPCITVKEGGQYIKMDALFEAHRFTCVLSPHEVDIIKNAHPDIEIKQEE